MASSLHRDEPEPFEDRAAVVRGVHLDVAAAALRGQVCPVGDKRAVVAPTATPSRLSRNCRATTSTASSSRSSLSRNESTSPTPKPPTALSDESVRGGFAGTLKPGAKLARFYVKNTGPNPRIDKQPQFHLVPAIHERLTLADFLERTMVATRLLLHEFAEPPASAVALLGTPIPPR
jgi:hypothetical protein